MCRLSADVTTSATGSRSTNSSLALAFLPSESDYYRRSVNNESIYNESIYNESIHNESVYNESIYNESVYNESAYRASVNNKSVYHASVNNESVYRASVVDNASVYAASVSSASVSELYSPSINTQNSSHTTSSEVTPIIATPLTSIPGAQLEQQQSLPNIPTRPVPPDGTSTADHLQDPQRPSTPGQPITNVQHNLDANEDQYGPLPDVRASPSSSSTSRVTRQAINSTLSSNISRKRSRESMPFGGLRKSSTGSVASLNSVPPSDAAPTQTSSHHFSDLSSSKGLKLLSPRVALTHSRSSNSSNTHQVMTPSSSCLSLSTPSPAPSSVDEEELLGDEEMLQYIKRQQQKKLAHGATQEELDALIRLPEPLPPAASQIPSSMFLSVPSCSVTHVA